MTNDVLPPIYTAVMRRLQAAPIVIDISACNHEQNHFRGDIPPAEPGDIASENRVARSAERNTKFKKQEI